MIKKVQGTFPGCAHVKTLGLLNSSDREIWDFAKANDYAVMTFDSDFADFSIAWGAPPKIIWITSGNIFTDEITFLLLNNNIKISHFLEQSTKALLTISR